MPERIDHLPTEFWEWVRSDNYICRQPQGSPINRLRLKRIREHQQEWYRMHPETPRDPPYWEEC